MSEIIDNESVILSKRDGNEKLPSSGGILTLGILSIVFAGLVGLVLGIIGTSMSKKSLQLYKDNPSKYMATSFSHVKAGRVCGIIGICLSSLALFIVILIAIANS